jgi:hypothetical protein
MRAALQHGASTVATILVTGASSVIASAPVSVISVLFKREIMLFYLLSRLFVSQPQVGLEFAERFAHFA